MSFALKSRRVLLPSNQLVPATVSIREGRIAAIQDQPLPGLVVQELEDTVLMPALTDTHIHINEPGRTEWEGFYTATQAAAAGGVTALADMPLNSIPVTTTVAALEEKKAAAEEKLWVDCGFWGGVIPGNAGELAAMVEAGAPGFKCFTCFSGIDEFPASTAKDLRLAMPILKNCRVPLLVHAELESELRQEDASPRLYSRYLHSRPKEWEDTAVAMIVELVRETGCRAHIVHLSSSGALEILRGAKREGLPITAETCPHYLGLAAEEIPDGATEFKCAPPIRERENQDRLWAALLEGTLDFVVTDHSPCIPALKRQDTGDFMAAWGGIASLQLGLRSVWTEAAKRGIPLEQVHGWMAVQTAQFLGRPGRGRLVVGAEANLVAFKPEPVSVLSHHSLLQRHPISPWVGKLLEGIVAGTWLRGKQIWDGSNICGMPQGRILLGREQ